MKQRIHLKKKRRKIGKKKFLFVTMLFSVLGVILSLNYINKRFTPILVETAELEIGKFSTIVVNKAIAQVLED